jgi:hypothetical protein
MPDYKEIKLYSGLVTILFDDTVDTNGRPKHAYYLLEDGKKTRLCGVTTFLKVLDKPALVPWAVRTTVEYIRKNLDQLQEDPNKLLERARKEADSQRDTAAEIGKAIHAWIEEYIKGENPEMPEDDRVLVGVNSFLDWAHDNNVEFMESEKIVYSAKHKFVGTADIIAIIDGKLYLLDIKTGNGIYSEVKLQTAAYAVADMEETGRDYAGRIVLRISKETEEEYNARMTGKKEIPPFKIFEAVNLDPDEGSMMKDFDAFLNIVKMYRWKQYAESKLNKLRS